MYYLETRQMSSTADPYSPSLTAVYIPSDTAALLVKQVRRRSYHLKIHDNVNSTELGTYCAANTRNGTIRHTAIFPAVYLLIFAMSNVQRAVLQRTTFQAGTS